MEKKVYMHKVRDFGEVFGDSTVFLRDNWKKMGRSLVMLVAPVYTIASIFFSIFSIRFVETIQNTASSNGNPTDIPSLIFSPITLIAFLLFYASYILATGIVFAYIKAYNDSDTGDIQVKDVWEALKPKLGKIIFYPLGYGLILGVFFGLLVGILAILPIFIPVLFLAYLGLFFLSLSYFSVLYPVLFYENEGFIDSITRCFAIVRNKVWQTLAVNFVASIIVQTIAGSFMLLIYIPLILSLTSFREFALDILKVIMIFALVLLPLVTFLVRAYHYSVMSLQYYSLLERTNYVGLKERIENIGQAVEKQTDEEF